MSISKNQRFCEEKNGWELANEQLTKRKVNTWVQKGKLESKFVCQLAQDHWWSSDTAKFETLASRLELFNDYGDQKRARQRL